MVKCQDLKQIIHCRKRYLTSRINVGDVKCVSLFLYLYLEISYNKLRVASNYWIYLAYPVGQQ